MDRQTDQNNIKCEMAIYKYLGVSESFLYLYESMHHNWYFKGKNVSGILDGMRQTGQ